MSKEEARNPTIGEQLGHVLVEGPPSFRNFSPLKTVRWTNGHSIEPRLLSDREYAGIIFEGEKADRFAKGLGYCWKDRDGETSALSIGGRARQSITRDFVADVGIFPADRSWHLEVPGPNRSPRPRAVWVFVEADTLSDERYIFDVLHLVGHAKAYETEGTLIETASLYDHPHSSEYGAHVEEVARLLQRDDRLRGILTRYFGYSFGEVGSHNPKPLDRHSIYKLRRDFPALSRALTSFEERASWDFALQVVDKTSTMFGFKDKFEILQYIAEHLRRASKDNFPRGYHYFPYRGEDNDPPEDKGHSTSIFDPLYPVPIAISTNR